MFPFLTSDFLYILTNICVLLSLYVGPIVVGYDQTVYTTTESDGGILKLCANVLQPKEGQASRPFTLATVVTGIIIP